MFCQETKPGPGVNTTARQIQGLREKFPAEAYSDEMNRVTYKVEALK